MSPPLPANLKGTMTDREAIADALYRIVTAFDLNDESMLLSSITEDISGEIPAQNLMVKGLEEFKTGVFNRTSKLDTMHSVSNIRIDIESDVVARMTCSAVAQHCYPGKGVDPSSPKLTSGGIYTCDVVKVGQLWKLRTWKMDLIWLDGDAAVVTGV